MHHTVSLLYSNITIPDPKVESNKSGTWLIEIWGSYSSKRSECGRQDEKSLR